MGAGALCFFATRLTVGFLVTGAFATLAGFLGAFAAVVMAATAIESVTSAEVFAVAAGEMCGGRRPELSLAKASAAPRVRMYPAAYTAMTAAEPSARRPERFPSCSFELMYLELR